jgi:hypothetical protein
MELKEYDLTSSTAERVLTRDYVASMKSPAILYASSSHLFTSMF